MKKPKTPKVESKPRVCNPSFTDMVAQESIDTSFVALLFGRGGKMTTHPPLQVLRLEKLVNECFVEPNCGFAESRAVPLFVFATRYLDWLLEHKQGKAGLSEAIADHSLDCRVGDAIHKLKIAIATHMPDRVRITAGPDTTGAPSVAAIVCQ